MRIVINTFIKQTFLCQTGTSIFSRSYCYTVWWAIGIIMSSVRPSVCDAVHWGSQVGVHGQKLHQRVPDDSTINILVVIIIGIVSFVMLCYTMFLQVKSVGQVLFNDVVQKLGVLETDYFDLQYTNAHNVNVSTTTLYVQFMYSSLCSTRKTQLNSVPCLFHPEFLLHISRHFIFHPCRWCAIPAETCSTTVQPLYRWQKCFSGFGASFWNRLPSHVTSAPSLAIFRRISFVISRPGHLIWLLLYSAVDLVIIIVDI